MTTAAQLAKYVLAKTGHSMSGKRLQKLVYFCDAWHVTALNRPLVENEPQAWANGPVYTDVWSWTRYRYFGVNHFDLKHVEDVALEEDSKLLVDAVMEHYGRFTDDELIELSHEPGTPWQRVYEANRNCLITHESMRQHYSGVIARNLARPDFDCVTYDYLLPEDLAEVRSSLDDDSPAPGLVSMLVKAKTG